VETLHRYKQYRDIFSIPVNNYVVPPKKGFQRVAVKYISVYESKEVARDSSWEILASAETTVCQTALY
jgi:hypothetical protein